MRHSPESQSENLLTKITMIMYYIQQIMDMCFNYGHHSRPLSQICGLMIIKPLNSRQNIAIGDDIQSHGMQHINHINSDYFINLLSNYTTHVEVQHIHITWTSNCEVNYLEITRFYQNSSASRYCGYHPAWNESGSMKRITIRVKVSLNIGVFDVKMMYFLGKTMKWILYKRRYVFREPFHIPVRSLSNLMGDTAVICTLISQYVNIIKIGFQHNIREGFTYVLYDGPGLENSLLAVNSMLSSTHQFTIRMFLAGTKCMQTDISVTYLRAPEINININNNHSINISLLANFYHSFSLSKITLVDIRQENLHVHGYTGSNCEYGGIVYSMDSREQIDYGPYCQKDTLHTQSISKLTLPFQNIHVILYSYSGYTRVVVFIMIQSRSYFGDVLPICYCCYCLNRIYGRICYDHWIRMKNIQYIKSFKFYFLPQQCNKKIFALSFPANMPTVVDFKGHQHDDCRIIGGRPKFAKLNIVAIRCLESVPIFLIRSRSWMSSSNSDNMRRLVFVDDVKIAVSNVPPNHAYCKFLIRGNRQRDFYIIRPLSATCSNTTLRLSSWDYGTKFHTNLFIFEKELDIWQSVGYEFRMMFNSSNNLETGCAMSMELQRYQYTICSRHWFDNVHICYSYWQQPWDITHVCIAGRCYTHLQGGNWTWWQAQKQCRSVGWNLVVVNSFEEQRIVRWILRTSFYELHHERIYLGIIFGNINVMYFCYH